MGRGRGWLLLIAALVAGATLAALTWLRPMLAYDAIAEGSFGSAGPDGRRVEAGPFGHYVSIRYRAGLRTGVDASIANRGDRDVEITELGDRATLTAVSPTGARIAPRAGAVRPERYMPFRPFELRAGQQRAVRLGFRTGRCSELLPGATATVKSFNLRYRLSFAEREKTIELRSPIEFRRGRACRGR